MSSAHAAVVEVSAVPYEDRSFQVKWTAEVTSGLTGYVVEWKPLLEPDLCHTQFELVNKSQSSLNITGRSIDFVLHLSGSVSPVEIARSSLST